MEELSLKIFFFPNSFPEKRLGLYFRAVCFLFGGLKAPIAAEVLILNSNECSF